MKIARHAAVVLALALGGTSVAKAASLSIGIGPEMVGNGGSYPLFLPPVDPGQYTLTFVADGGFETNISLYPGLHVGQRFKSGGLYVSVGAGLLIDGNGAGFGPYSAFGYETGGGASGWHFCTTYTQTLGISRTGYIAPSSLRLGTIWEY